jgi:hypothetical protein
MEKIIRIRTGKAIGVGGLNQFGGAPSFGAFWEPVRKKRSPAEPGRTLLVESSTACGAKIGLGLR